MKNNKIHGKCALCLCEKELIRSHIIPEGFYTNLYDNKGRTFYSSPSRNRCEYVQKGLRENLLCTECDNGIIGKYDKYGIEVIRDGKHVTKENFSDAEIWNGLDFRLFRLFHLSILWRSHLSVVYSKNVHLDDQIAEIIRNMLLSGQSPNEFCFPFLGYILRHPSDTDPSDRMGIIHIGNTYLLDAVKKIEVVVVIFGGISWTYYLSESSSADRLSPIFFKTDGRIILQHENVYKHAPLMDRMQSIMAVASRTEI